ncbi:MAG: hypothetical protein ACHBN1_01435 [Heteroscytonema crispum UTEX LB 1556]
MLVLEILGDRSFHNHAILHLNHPLCLICYRGIMGDNCDRGSLLILKISPINLE